MKKVLVLLSTYNGEKYIKEQLDSILNQTIKQYIDILVRDDGSNDNTVSILKEYCEHYDNIEILAEENLGVKRSFFRLMELAGEYEYYAFADQDDYWECKKLEVAIEKLESESKNKPLMYFSTMKFVDEKLQALKGGVNPKEKYNFGNIIIKNNANGCTMVVNKKTLDMVKKGINKDIIYDKIPLHDHWIYLVTLALGGTVIFDRDSYIKYRQHSNNQVGMDKGILTKIRKNTLFNGYHIRYGQVQELARIYSMDMAEQELHLVNRVLGYHKSFNNKLKLAFDRNIKPVNKLERVRIFITVLNGTF